MQAIEADSIFSVTIHVPGDTFVQCNRCRVLVYLSSEYASLHAEGMSVFCNRCVKEISKS